jgi:DNA-binding MarR family transcriptional regulator
MARVIVGQYGPAAAHVGMDRAPGTRPSRAANASGPDDAVDETAMAGTTSSRATILIRPTSSKIPTRSQHFTDDFALCPAYDPPVRDADLLQELHSTGVLVALLVDDELARIGVPDQLFSFIGWVARLQPVTPGTLSRETGLPPTTIRDHIRRLVASGDARKVPNPRDGRSYHLVLTPRGQRVADSGWPAVVAAFERIERHLGRPAAEHIATIREIREAVGLALAESRAESTGLAAQAVSAAK